MKWQGHGKRNLQHAHVVANPSLKHDNLLYSALAVVAARGAWDSESLKRPSGDLHESAGWSLVSALRAEVNLAKSARFALITLCLRHARAPESTFSKDVGVVVLFKLYMHMRMVHVFITMIRVTNTVLKAWSYIEVFCNVRALVL